MRRLTNSRGMWLLVVLSLGVIAWAADFHWDWTGQKQIDSFSPKLAIGAGLSNAERNALIDAISAHLKPEMTSQGYSDDRIRDVVVSSHFLLIDLNHDGKPEVFASPNSLEAGCSPAGGCPLWVLRRSAKGGYNFVLEAEAQTFTVQPTSTGGFSDIVTAHHTSGFDAELTLYRFAMGKYVASGCYIATSAEMKGDEVEPLPEPRVAPCTSEQQ